MNDSLDQDDLDSPTISPQRRRYLEYCEENPSDEECRLYEC